MNEHELVNHVLLMLQDLEGELFVKKINLQEAGESCLDAPVVDALVSKDFERIWTWTTKFEISLSSLIAPSLRPQLEHFINLASQVSRLTEASRIGSVGYGSICFSIALSLKQYIQGFHSQIHKIQEVHAKRSLNLIQIHTLIEGLGTQFKFVASIGHEALQPLPNIDYSSSVDDLYPDRERPGKAERAAQVFRVLDMAMESKVDQERSMKLVMWIFMNCLRRYLEKVDLWLLYGYLAPIDREEFCIVSHSNDHVTSNIFWDSTYAATKAEVPTFLQSSIQHILCTGKASLLLKYLQPAKEKLSAGNGRPQVLDASEHEPLFAKARRLFSKHFSDTWLTFNPFIPSPNNSNKLLKSSPAVLDPSLIAVSAVARDSNSGRSSSPGTLNTSQDSLMLPNYPNRFEDGCTDETGSSRHPFFSISAQRSSKDAHQESSWPSSEHMDISLIGKRITSGNDQSSELDLTHVSNFGVPISSVFNDCISEPIREHYIRINSELIDVLVNQVGVLEHLQVAQQFFFIEAPLSDLYTLSVLPTLWNYTTVNEVTLNHWLKQTLEASMSHYRPNFAAISQRVSLHVLPKNSQSSSSRATSSEPISEEEEMKIRSMRGAEDVSRIWINYEADWPTSLFLTNRTHDLYNSISSSLSSIMAAQYVLEQLTTVNKNPDPSTATSVNPHRQKMHLFRTELMLFIRNVREYMVSRITQVPWSHIEQEMRKATDLDQLRSIHLNYLSTIQERCLLSDQFSVVKKSLDRIMSIAIDFARQYQILHTSLNPTSMSTLAAASTSTSLENQVFLAGVGVDSMSQERLIKLTEKLRAEFLRYHKLLTTFLSKISSTATYVSDLLVRLNFSEFYKH